jgi:hypothetical protein
MAFFQLPRFATSSILLIVSWAKVGVCPAVSLARVCASGNQEHSKTMIWVMLGIWYRIIWNDFLTAKQSDNSCVNIFSWAYAQVTWYQLISEAV